MEIDHKYNTRSKINKDPDTDLTIAKHTREIIKIDHERSKKKYKIRDTPAKKSVIVKSKKSINKDLDNSYHMEFDAKDLSVLLLKSLVYKANKQLKANMATDGKLKIKSDDDDEDYDATLDAYKNIENLNEEIEYTEDEYKYINNLEPNIRNQFVELENEIVDISKEEIPIRFKILSSNMDLRTKGSIIRKIDHFYQLDPSDNEYQKLYPWVEQLDKIPFGKYCPTEVTQNDPAEKIQKYLINTKEAMDEAVYGHDIAKTQILSIVARDISNPASGGNCIAIEGPMGNGKTTLVKEGICKAMNRPFAFIALGGMQDSSYLQGHEITYEGSKCGRIIEMLTETGCMNPIIFFDELDKVSDTPKGEEITNLLCHLTDASQNKEFHDKYFSGINFDLSRATFIFSYNNASSINPILLDRMYKIKTKGFDKKAKTKIATDYLLPKILTEFNFHKKDINFDIKAIHKLIDNFSDNEEGVRNLKRNIETIIFKLNVMRYLKPENVKLTKSNTNTSNDDKSQDEPSETKAVSNDKSQDESSKTKAVSNDKEPVENKTVTNDKPQDEPAENKTVTNDKPQDEPVENKTVTNDKPQDEPAENKTVTNDKPQDEPAENKTVTNDKPQDELAENKTVTNDKPQDEPSENKTVTNDKPQDEPSENKTVTDNINLSITDFKLDITNEVTNEVISIPKDIVNFNIKNFKIPYNVTENDISFFLKNDTLNPSLAHLYT